MKWIGTHNIMFISGSTIDKLMENDLVSEIADLYSLSVNDVLHIDGLGTGFQRVIDEIERSRHTTLTKLLAGYDMDGIGERVWQPIIDNLKIETLVDLINILAKDASILSLVPGIGPERSFKIIEEIAEHGNELLALEAILDIKKPVKVAPVSSSLSGKSFCFTGALCIKRAEAEKMVTTNGGTLSSVKKGLSFLVTDDVGSGSAKATKALELGIPVISGAKFLEMVK
jgi:DNA ligase (NAD+)